MLLALKNSCYFKLHVLSTRHTGILIEVCSVDLGIQHLEVRVSLELFYDARKISPILTLSYFSETFPMSPMHLLELLFQAGNS